LWSIEIANSTTTYYQENYANTQSVSIDAPTYPLPIGLIKGNNGTITPYFVQYLRTRIYPPNGVMPKVEVGSVT